VGRRFSWSSRCAVTPNRERDAHGTPTVGQPMNKAADGLDFWPAKAEPLGLSS
jgi:hypothetical protein